MGRSGTSALTRTLSLCGAALPDALLGPNEGNPAGHWEPLDALKLNDAFLSRHGSNWYDPTLRLQEEVVLEDRERESYIDAIVDFFAACPDASLLAIKDPRISAVPTFWVEAAQRANYRVTAVIAVRHPGEVAASLAAREYVSFELSCLLWLKYNLLAERHSRALPRVFVDYVALLHGWPAQIARIGEALGLALDVTGSVAVDAFLRGDLHRQRSSLAFDDPAFSRLVRRMSAQLNRAVGGAAPDLALIDEIYADYKAYEWLFRIAGDDFRVRFNPFAEAGPANAVALHPAVERSVLDSEALPANGHFYVDDVMVDGKAAIGAIVLGPASVLTILGWGVDRLAGDVGSAVFAVANHMFTRGEYGFARSDVAQTLQNTRYFPSGFKIDIPSSRFPPGDHRIDIRLLAADQRSVYDVAEPPTVSVRTNQLGVDSALA
jgi:hypothetical protein